MCVMSRMLQTCFAFVVDIFKVFVEIVSRCFGSRESTIDIKTKLVRCSRIRTINNIHYMLNVEY